MRITELHKHLYTYDDHRLRDVTINGRKYRTLPDFEPTLIICMSFGKSAGQDSYNARLAAAILDARSHFGNIPVIAQREVHDIYVQDFGPAGVFGVCKRLERDTYVTTDVRTKDAMDEARQVVRDYALDPSRILYIAHPAHIFRVLAMGRRMEIDGMALDGVPFLDTSPSYNADDGQRFVRGPRAFAWRELGARVHHKMRGWI